MNILFTCVGRRVELIQAFKKHSAEGSPVVIHGTDASLTAPAARFCDYSYVAPLIKEDTYIPFLLDVCKRNNIQLLIPTIDTDLIVLSENIENFKKVGTRVLISDPEVIKKCRDKRLTGLLFADAGLLFPKCVDRFEDYTMGYPAFIKPLNGSSSINAFRADTKEELKALTMRIPQYIIQPFVSGDEYTIDILCDFDGNPVFITPRKRLAVRSGEVLTTEICQDPVVIEEAKKLVSVMKPCGPVAVQLIREKVAGKDWFIEINPRFGGGAPLSMKAGADAAMALINMIENKPFKANLSAAKNHTVFTRFDQSVQIP